MATVTGLTAERMLAMEAASVIDGDIVGDDLVLTTKGGAQINAGNVRGPQGPEGPMGTDLSVLTSIPVLDVGMSGQIRAGRQLTAADFTNMGLSVPLGLWNLSDLTDASGNGRNLSNKGSIPFGSGINGLASSAAVFSGATAQALYISDVGVNDPFRIRTGSWGCWFRTAKRGVTQFLVVKGKADASNRGFTLSVHSSNVASMSASYTGSDGTDVYLNGSIDIADDRWHFIVATIDGTMMRLYLDGILEANNAFQAVIFTTPASAGPFNIGGWGGDAGTATFSPCYGRIDEAFITSDILSDEQIRNLYCAKIPHILGAIPQRVNLNVRRRRKGAAFAVSDFPSQPLRLHNFTNGALTDEGSAGIALVNVNNANPAPGSDGLLNGSFNLVGTSSQYLNSTDAGLPSGLATRSYGLWFKGYNTVGKTIMGWGTLSTGDARLWIDGSQSLLVCSSGADNITGPYLTDAQWHFIVVVEDNIASDGLKRKLYVDGRLVGSSTGINNIVLQGANNFRLGANPSNAVNSYLTGQVDGAFVHSVALTAVEIAKLYAKGSQALALSPKNSGDHIEAMDVGALLATFDTLGSQDLVDLGVGV